MKYDNPEIKSIQVELKQCTEKVETLSIEVFELRQQLKAPRRQLHSANCAFRDVTNEILLLKKQRDVAEKKAVMFQKSHSSLEEIVQLQENSIELSLAISDLESELASISKDIATTCTVGNVDFSIQWKEVLSCNMKTLLHLVG